MNQVDVKRVPERRLYLLGFAGTEQAVIYEYAGQLTANGFLNERGRH